MICPKCNKQYAEDEKFCSKCGSVLINENIYNVDVQPEQVVQPIESAEAVQAEEKENSQENAKKRWIIIGTIIAIVLIVFLCWFFSPTESFKRCINEGKYTEAAQYVWEVNDINIVTDALEEKAWGACEDYNRDMLDFNTAIETLWNLQNVYSSDMLYNIEAEIRKLQSSKQNFINAEAAETAGSKELAIERYSEVIPADINYDEAQNRLETLKEEYKQKVLSQAEETASSESYEAAILLLRDAEYVIGADEEITAAIEEYTGLLEQDVSDGVLSAAQEYADAGDYQTAIETLQTAEFTTDEITARLEEYQDAYCQIILQEAEALYSEGNYAEALACFNGCFFYCGDSEELQAKLDEYTAVYRKEALTTAAGYAENSEYEQAVDCLQDAVVLLGGDTEIEEKIAEYEAKYPVHLYDLSPSSGGDYATEELYEDIYGNRFEKGLVMYSDNCEYVADSQYKKLRGTIMIPEDMVSFFEYNLKIYADDRLIYDSGILTYKSRPIEFDLDISGVDFVQFEADYEPSDRYYDDSCILISDPVFIS